MRNRQSEISCILLAGSLPETRLPLFSMPQTGPIHVLHAPPSVVEGRIYEPEALAEILCLPEQWCAGVLDDDRGEPAFDLI